MPDSDILAEFQEFLTQREANAKADADNEDEEIELWNEKGQGGRVRRSRAPSFARALGIDWFDEPTGTEGDNNSDNDQDKSKPKPGKTATGKQSSNVASGGVARKYFGTKPAGK